MRALKNDLKIDLIRSLLPRTLVRRGLLILATLACVPTFGEDARLSIESDLVIHPEDISTVLERSVEDLNKKRILGWNSMNLTSPLKSRLLAIVTANPLMMAIDSIDPVEQTLQFALNWDDPGINIGRLEIDDQVKRTVNGVNIILDLKGACENLKMRLPGGRWRMSGELSWKWVGTQPIFKIVNLSLFSRPANVEVDFGQCDVPQDLAQEMRNGVMKVLGENSRLEEIFRRGLLEWLSSRFQNFEEMLLTPREYSSGNSLNFKWMPATISNARGVILVHGLIQLQRSGLAKATLVNVKRDAAMKGAGDVGPSGFLLPSAATKALTRFIYDSDLVRRRFSSKSVPALKPLFESKIAQMLYWPDLTRFPTSAEYWFDLSMSSPPTVKGALNRQDGVVVTAVAPIALLQWAPEEQKYVPYVRFTSTAVGDIHLSVKSAQLNLDFTVQKLNLAYGFDNAFLTRHPSVNTWMQIKTFEEKIQGALVGKIWQFQLPQIPVSERQQLGLSGIEILKQGLMLRMDSLAIP